MLNTKHMMAILMSLTASVGSKAQPANAVPKHIIAIGGRAFLSPYAIEKYIIAQTGKQNPKVCFLSQASAEQEAYIIRFYQAFSKVGAQPSHISLFGRVEPTWVEHLLDQDIIFVGGGNTKSMLGLWRTWGLDEVLKRAYENGTVLAGVSAGAICWFEQGITDSVWPLGVLACMGMLEGSCCPHYDGESERRPFYTRAVAENEALSGIALCDFTAAHFVDGSLVQVLSWSPDRHAYHVTLEGHQELEITSLLESELT